MMVKFVFHMPVWPACPDFFSYLLSHPGLLDPASSIKPKLSIQNYVFSGELSRLEKNIFLRVK